MISLTQFFQDLTNPALAFLPKALLVAVLSAMVCGVVGAHVVLRGMAFIGDAVAHAVFPGLAIAFALQSSVVVGGAVAGIVVAVLIAVFSQRRRIKEDTIIGIFFAAAFAAGLVVISKVQGYTASLTSFLFGSITGVATEDIVMVAVVGAAVLVLLTVFHNQLIAVSLDRETAAAQNIRVFAFDLLLYLAVTAAVVMSVRTVGNILVLALLVTPAATARLVTDRLPVMMVLSAAIGAVASVVGVYLSWAWDIPTGATIVLVVTACFLLAFFGSSVRSLFSTPRAARPRQKTLRTRVAGSVAAVMLLAGGAFIGPVVPGSPSGRDAGEAGDAQTVREGRSALSIVAPVASAQPNSDSDVGAGDPTDGMSADSADAENADGTGNSGSGNGGESNDGAGTDGRAEEGERGEGNSTNNGDDSRSEGLTRDDETLVEGLIRVFKKLNVDILRLAQNLPAVVKNIIALTESLRGDDHTDARRNHGDNRGGAAADATKDKERKKQADRVAGAIIDRTKNPDAHVNGGTAGGGNGAEGEKKTAGGNTGGDNSNGAAAGDLNGGGAVDTGGDIGGGNAVGGSAGDAGVGEDGAKGADDLLEMAAEDVLAGDGVEGTGDQAGGIKALGFSGKHGEGKENKAAGGADGGSANAAKQDQSKIQQLASSLTAGGFGGGFTMGVGLMALLGGGLFFLMAARNMREMKLAMLQADLERELAEERRAEAVYEDEGEEQGWT